MIRRLPYDEVDAVYSSASCGCRHNLLSPNIEQDRLHRVRLPTLFLVRYNLSRPINQRARVAGSRLEDLYVNMNVNAFQLSGDTRDQDAVADFTLPLATKENAPPLRYVWQPAPSHPICGTAPYIPERYLR